MNVHNKVSILKLAFLLVFDCCLGVLFGLLGVFYAFILLSHLFFSPNDSRQCFLSTESIAGKVI